MYYLIILCILCNLVTAGRQFLRWIISRVKNYPGNKPKLVCLPFRRKKSNYIGHLNLKEKRVYGQYFEEINLLYPKFILETNFHNLSLTYHTEPESSMGRPYFSKHFSLIWLLHDFSDSNPLALTRRTNNLSAF